MSEGRAQDDRGGRLGSFDRLRMSGRNRARILRRAQYDRRKGSDSSTGSG